MKEENIPKADEIILNILILPNSIVNFERIGIMMVSKGQITGEEFGVKKAKYLGDGKWEAIDKIPLKKIDPQAHKGVKK